MKDDFDRDFIDSMNFAALMTLLETMEEEAQEKEDSICHNTPAPKIETFNPNTDITQGKERLAHIMKTICDEADRVCNTKTEGDASEFVSGLLCGLFWEAIETTSATDGEKCSIYDFAVAFSRISVDIDGSMLFPTSSKKVADVLTALTDQTVSMILTGASKANIQMGFGFAKVLAEFLCDVETAIHVNFPSTTFRDRLPVIALIKFIDCSKSLMKTMEEENPDIKNNPEVMASHQKRVYLEKLKQNALSSLSCERFTAAQDYYEKVLMENPDDWEAIFYSVYCDCVAAGNCVIPREIIPNCVRMGMCICKAVKKAKQQLFSRNEILDGIGNIAVKTTHIASNFFAATMNDYRQSGGNSIKIQRVNAIIKMLFDVGDAIEQSFSDNTAICAATAYE